MEPQQEDWKVELEDAVDTVRHEASDFSKQWAKHANRRTIIVSVLAGVVFGALYLYGIRPPDSFPAGQLVTVPQDESVSDIAAVLKQDGIIRSTLMFRLLVKVMGSQKHLHAGDYLFKQPEDVFSIARAISNGSFGLEPYHIRIPEGATVSQMANIFTTVLPRFDKQQFLAEAKPQEGYLFPDTYYFLPNATAQTVLDAMRQNFDVHEAKIDAEVKAFGKPLDQVVIMASIVEKEARTTQDRRMIAGVLWRRIRLGMPLQADATFLYTLGKGSAQLTMADLKSDSPYNTYTHKGLPPTPIDSPSINALEDTVTPIDNGYLYYLADAQGITHYCKTYACQLANQRKYLGN